MCIRDSGRLVQHHQPRIVLQGLYQPQLLLHAARVSAHRPAQRRGGQAQPPAQLPAARGGDALEGGQQVEGLLPGELRVQPQLTREIPERVREPAVAAQGIEPEDPDPAGCRPQQAGQAAQRGRLARPVGTEEPEDLTLVHGQAQALDPDDRPVQLGQATQLDGTHIHPHTPSLCPRPDRRPPVAERGGADGHPRGSALRRFLSRSLASCASDGGSSPWRRASSAAKVRVKAP